MSALEYEEPGEDAIAWRRFCQRLEALGDRLTTPEFPQTPVDRAEGIRHLAQQAMCWLNWSLAHGDPTTPAFQRQNDLVTKWGGPNIDNVYRHVRVQAGHRYRIWGRMHSCDQFILAVRAGFMHMERWGTLVEVTASELGIRRGENFEFFVGGADDPVALPAEAIMVSIREYYFDWFEAEPATFAIECLDADGPPARPQPTDIAVALDEAIDITESSIEYWNRYMIEKRAEAVPNTFMPGLRNVKGLDAARYSFCWYDLGPDEALYIESDVPEAPYWSLQLYTLAWFESFDVANRLAGLNHHQLHVNDDGRVRAVLSARDPGVPNWLDSEGRDRALLTYRWFWATREPTPLARVVPFTEVDSLFPPDTPRFGSDERRAQLDERRRHIAWRFRT